MRTSLDHHRTVLASRAMRRLSLLLLAAGLLAVIAAGCGGSSKKESAGTPGTTAASCSKGSLDLVHAGRLTIGTSNPAYPPWYAGGTKSSYWKVDDPNNGQGYESAVAYALAKQLGFSKSEVKWIAVGFNPSIAPGPKNYDFNIQQVSFNHQRAKAVEFSRSYFQENQSVVALEGRPIASAKTLADLKKYKLGAQVGTTSYDYIVDNIKPTQKPQVYDTLNDAITALNNHQIDGLVTDFPGAYYIADVQLSNGVIVGRLPTIGAEEHFGMTLEKGNPLVTCINKALAALKQDGTLQRLEQKWITGKAKAPLITQT
jgi:polar amino acid transport system substrate-binding protein